MDGGFVFYGPCEIVDLGLQSHLLNKSNYLPVGEVILQL